MRLLSIPALAFNLAFILNNQGIHNVSCAHIRRSALPFCTQYRHPKLKILVSTRKVRAVNTTIDRKSFAIKFALAGIAVTILSYAMLVLLLPNESSQTILTLCVMMFGVPFLLSSLLASMTVRANVNALRGMTIGLLVVSVLITLYSLSIVIFYNGAGANIGGLAGLLLSPICYCVGGYLGWKSRGKL